MKEFEFVKATSAFCQKKPQKKPKTNFFPIPQITTNVVIGKRTDKVKNLIQENHGKTTPLPQDDF